MTNYEELLEEAHKKIKKIDNTESRFEIPKIEGHFEGKKTILILSLSQTHQVVNTPLMSEQNFCIFLVTSKLL